MLSLSKHLKLILPLTVLAIYLIACPFASAEQTYIPDRYKGIILSAPEPVMPSIAYSHNKQSGTGLYRLVINSHGGVEEVKVLRRIGEPRVDAEAVFVLFKWKFRPGALKCIDVPIVYLREFHAELRDAQSQPAPVRR